MRVYYSSIAWSLVVLMCVCSVTCYGASQSYELQRQFGEAGAWESIIQFSVSRRSPDTPAHIKSTPLPDVELTSALKTVLSGAAFVRYRVVPEQKENTEDKAAVSVAISPCTLVRGFEAADARTVVLNEEIGVVVGPGNSVVGLQVSSSTNTFHAKMLNGDECDMSVLSLFPQVRLRAGVRIVQPVSIYSTPNYVELNKVTNLEGKEQAKPHLPGSPEDSSEEDESNKKDERSFLQKYWLYLVLPFLFSLLQGVLSKQ